MDTHDHHHLMWAEIDLDAIAHNVAQIRQIIPPSTRLLIAAKANGYGHGAVAVARTALKHGATDIGVARLDEGIALRHAGIKAPILIFGYTPADQINKLIRYDLNPSVAGFENGQALAKAADAAGHPICVHLKVDSGMGRLGVPCDDLRLEDAPSALQTIRALLDLSPLRLEGVYTHFATADHADLDYARKQFSRFEHLLDQMHACGINIPLRHAANTGAIIQMPETHLDMVRAGISVYGLYPSEEIDRSRIALKPAMSLKARIIQVKHVPAGTPISYGCTHRTPCATTIATVPVGYADGYQRQLSNRGGMLVGGCLVPIVGRVCMDLTMIDVGQVASPKIDDEVVLMGRQGNAAISADDIARALDTINYEIVSGLTERVPRIYLEGGKITTASEM